MKVQDLIGCLGVFVGLFIVALPLSFGYIYLPTRLYLIGEEHRETIVAIELKEDVLRHRWSSTRYPYSSLTLQNHPGPFKATQMNYVVGQQVTLLYSDRLHRGVIVPSDYGYFSVLYHFQPFYGVERIIQAILICIGLAIAIPMRGQRIVVHLVKRTAAAWHETVRNKKDALEKTVAITDFLSQFSTMCVAVSCVFVLVVFFVKVVLLVEQTGLFLTTLTLMAACYILLTPTLEKIIDAIIEIKQDKAFKELILILRNLVATVAGGILVYKLIVFTLDEDFRKFENVANVFLELISVLLG